MARNIAKTQRGTILKRQPAANRYLALSDIVADLAPSTDENVRASAVEQLRAAIDGLREQYPYVSNDRDSKMRANVKREREALKALAAKLEECGDSMLVLPPEALAQLVRKRKGQPIGRVVRIIKKLEIAARDAYLESKRIPDHPANDAPAHLAYGVASVLQDTLCAKIALSRASAEQGRHQVGANFERLLREVMKAAGLNPPKDLFPLMRTGKKLLADHGPLSVRSPHSS